MGSCALPIVMHLQAMCITLCALTHLGPQNPYRASVLDVHL